TPADRDHDDAEVFDFVTQLARELQTVFRPQTGDVEQRDVDPFLLADRERLGRSHRAGTTKPSRGQRLAHGRGVVRVVTDDEDVRQFGGHHGPLCKGLARNAPAFRDGNRPGRGELENSGTRDSELGIRGSGTTDGPELTAEHEYDGMRIGDDFE